MTTQSFPIGDAPRIVISNSESDLTIEVWDDRAIEIESDGQIGHVGQGDEAFVIAGASEELVVRVPYDAEVIADHVGGDLSARGFRALSAANVGGDLEIEDLSGPAHVERVGGDVAVHQVEAVVLVGKVGGSVEVESVGSAEVQQVSGDFEARDAQTLAVDSVSGDCNVQGGETFRYGTIGGDLSVEGDTRTAVVGGGVGGDAALHAIASAQLGDIGGDCALNAAGGDVRLGSVGGDCAINDVAGAVWLGSVGGDASVKAERSGVRIGNVGGDLHLASAFPADSVTRVTVGGDAVLELPSDASLTVRATVSGDVSGERIVASGGGMFTAVYGDGAAQLDLIVGGDLALRGGGAPRTSSSTWGWSDFGADMGRMGEELGQQFSQMGADLERELSGMFGPHGKYSSDVWERKVQQRVAEQLRRAEDRMRRAEQRARRAGEAAGRRAEPSSGRMHVRINDREWRFDAERLERLKQQAREAAREGISSAISAMERALSGMGVPPAAPVPPMPPVAPVPPMPPRAPVTGQTVRIDVPPDSMAEAAPVEQQAPAEPRNPEAERAAILQMIAEGRISPEEGDMLLDALG